jgi:hypothetical protein
MLTMSALLNSLDKWRLAGLLTAEKSATAR